MSGLYLTELNGTLANITISIPYGKLSPLIEHIFWFYLHSFIRLVYHFTMTLLTVDWFLAFHLNMKT